MSKLILLSVLLFSSFSSFADSDVFAECRLIVQETCGSKDLETCMKGEITKNFETCLGVLLPDSSAPDLLKPLQSKSLFDSSKASCFSVVKNNCSTMQVGECIANKGNLFSSGCRELYSDIQAQQERMNSVSGHCFKSKLDSCQNQHDMDLTNYDAFMNGLKQVEQCISRSIMADTICAKDIKLSAEERKKAKEKAEEEKVNEPEV